MILAATLQPTPDRGFFTAAELAGTSPDKKHDDYATYSYLELSTLRETKET